MPRPRSCFSSCLQGPLQLCSPRRRRRCLVRTAQSAASGRWHCPASTLGAVLCRPAPSSYGGPCIQALVPHSMNSGLSHSQKRFRRIAALFAGVVVRSLVGVGRHAMQSRHRPFSPPSICYLLALRVLILLTLHVFADCRKDHDAVRFGWGARKEARCCGPGPCLAYRCHAESPPSRIRGRKKHTKAW